MSKRYFEIDALRGLAIVTMIFTHTNAYFLHQKLVFLLWDISQWSVPVFIFCASYVYLKKTAAPETFTHLINYAKKRFFRLLRPYYLFAAVYVLLNYFKEPKKLTPDFFIKAATVTNAIDINWLVLLFLIFAVLVPVIHYLAMKRKRLFYLYSAAAIFSSILLIFYRFPGNYRLIMWLPWSLLIIFGWYMEKFENKNRLMVVGISISLMVFFILRLSETALHHSLAMFDNKYPPNLYHISYGIFSILLLYFLAKNKVFNLPVVKHILTFLSRYSYLLFFVHYLVIYFLMIYVKWQFTWVSFFVWVFIGSILTQLFLNVFQRYIKARRFGFLPVPAD